MVKITLKGDKALIAKLQNYRKQSPIKVGIALKQEAEEILTNSKENYVPIDTGTLKASGFVRSPEISSGRIVVRLGYGGAAQGYALIVHERLGVSHPVGQSKYLEEPMIQASNNMANNLVNKLKGMF